MREGKLIPVLVVAMCMCLTAGAQDLAGILFGKDSKKNYMGQYNYNGKRKNGFGIERYKDGAVYIGDFVEGEVSGRGMLISGKGGVSNVDGGIVYVGGWRAGKKNGRGVCYDASGSVVFSGRFAGDKPSESLPESDAVRRFAVMDKNGAVYFGEMSGNLQDGFGLTLQETGEIVFGTMRAGVRKGIGMVLYTPDSWEVGRWTDGVFSAFNSSETADTNIRSFRASNSEFNRQTRAALFEAAGSIVQTGLDIASAASGRSGGDGAVTGDFSADEDGGDVPAGKSKGYYQALYDKWESRAKNTYKDGVRHKATAETPGDFRIVTSEGKLLRTYQRSMEQTRRMAKKAGHMIKKSKYETISF